LIIAKKKIESIGPDHYRIALSLRNKYRKISSMRLPYLACRWEEVITQKNCKSGIIFI